MTLWRCMMLRRLRRNIDAIYDVAAEEGISYLEFYGDNYVSKEFQKNNMYAF